MQQGGEERVTGMEGVDVENGSAIARPEADAATAAKEAAKQVVAALSRRVRGIDKATGTVAGYARPGVDRLHTLRDVDDLRIKSTEAVAQRPGYKVGGLLGFYRALCEGAGHGGGEVCDEARCGAGGGRGRAAQLSRQRHM